MLNVMVTGLLCISMLLVASSCNLCLFTVKFYWNKKKKKKVLTLGTAERKISKHCTSSLLAWGFCHLFIVTLTTYPIFKMLRLQRHIPVSKSAIYCNRSKDTFCCIKSEIISGLLRRLPPL